MWPSPRNAATETERLLNELATKQSEDKISDIELLTQAKSEEQRLEFQKRAQEIELSKLTAQVEAIVEKAKAVSPDLIAALSAFGERAMVEKVSEAMAPLAILGGGSVVDILKKLLEGTSLSNVIDVSKQLKNGSGKSSATA